MVVTSCPKEFFLKNQKDVKRIISFHTKRSEKDFLDDMAGEFYLYMLKYRTLESFKMASANPLKCMQKAFQTWIYTAICNFLANQSKSKARKTEKLMIPDHKLSFRKDKSVKDVTDFLDYRTRKDPDSMTFYAGSLSRDEEESHALLEDFLDFIEDTDEGDELTRGRMKDTVRMAFSGMTGRQISEQIGMSSSFVSLMKGQARKKWSEFERRTSHLVE